MPHIKRGPQDQIVTEFGTTIVLKCETTKVVKAVKWFKNRKEIWPRQEKFSINIEETVATLTIMNFELNDCAEYTAALREDEESAPAKVELKIPPMIRLLKNLPSNVLKLHSGTDFDIEFVYDGFPEVDIRTTLNDKPFNEMRSRMHAYDNKLSLRLKNVIPEDSGVLKIVVENEIGSASEEIQLDVISVPSKPLNLTAFNITSRSVMLKWKEAKDNGSPIINYNIERRALDIKRWRNVGKCEPEQCEFLTEDLYPNESYSFRIVAVNEVGEGAPSNVVDVVTMNESAELKEITKLPSAPNGLKATLVEDGQTALITWKISEEAEEYIVERSKLENDWKQIGITAEPKFEDSFDESSSYKYRIVAKKGHYLSNPSEETEIVVVLAQKDAKQPDSETIEMLQEIPEMTEAKQQEMDEQKSEKPDDHVKQEKIGKKVAKKKKDKQEEKIGGGTMEVVEKSVGKPEEEEVKAKEKAKTEAMTRKKKPEEKQEEEMEDKFKPSEKVVEENEEKVGPKKVVKKKVQEKKKKEAEKEKISKGEVEVAKNFEEKKIEHEKQLERELEGEREKHKIKSDEEKTASTEKSEGRRAETKEAMEKKHLEKKLKIRPEKKAESLETVKVELEKDSEKKTEEKEIAEIKREDEKTTEDGKLAKKKKKTAMQESKETVEQKSDESVSQELAVEMKKEEGEEKETMKKEKLEVKPFNDSVTVNYGTKNFELSVDISGNYDKCFWTKDKKAVDMKLVKTTKNISVLRLENVDELTAGLYHCIVTKKTEKATAEIHVTVTGYPFVEYMS